MAKASVAIRTARAHLNDLNGITWSDSILMPLLQEAHGELLQELDVNNSSNLKVQTDPVTVVAHTKSYPSQPSNIVNPIEILEATPGSDISNYITMERRSFLPLSDLNNELIYWSWQNETILFLGALQDRSIILRYEGTLSTPQSLNDPLGILYAERFIGPRIAALAHAAIGKPNPHLENLSALALYKIIQAQVTNDQRPFRRRGYRTTLPTFGIPSGSVTIPVGGGGGTGAGIVIWRQCLTAPNGAVTLFHFNARPVYVSFNGLNKFEGTGYTVTGNVDLTFLDSGGVPFAPEAGTDIRGAFTA